MYTVIYTERRVSLLRFQPESNLGLILIVALIIHKVGALNRMTLHPAYIQTVMVTVNSRGHFNSLALHVELTMTKI